MHYTLDMRGKPAPAKVVGMNGNEPIIGKDAMGKPMTDWEPDARKLWRSAQAIDSKGGNLMLMGVVATVKDSEETVVEIIHDEGTFTLNGL
jgi:hypothetical protein